MIRASFGLREALGFRDGRARLSHLDEQTWKVSSHVP
jgi:hypothetical protein